VVHGGAPLARGPIRPEQRRAPLIAHRQELAVERIDHGGVDRSEGDLSKAPSIFEAMTADERKARLVQCAHLATELLVRERSAVLGKQPVQRTFALPLRRKLRKAPSAPRIEQRKEHALDALYGSFVIGA
jgi:hypothetical protein